MSVKGFVFTDLETTGVHSGSCEILEFGFALYSPELEPIERFSTLAVTTGTAALLQQLRTDPEYEFVRTMHTNSGLLDDLDAAIATGRSLPHDLSGYQATITELLTRWGVDRTTPLSGSSLRMDREFLARWTPGIDALFSYRIIDASSFREAGLIVNRDQTEARVALASECEAPSHRVLADIHNSANLLRVFHGFVPSPVHPMNPGTSRIRSAGVS